MNAIEFFNSDVVELPKDRNDDNFAAYVNHLFDAYRTQMQRVTNDSLVNQVITTRIETVDQVSEYLKEAVRNQLSGYPHLAYASLDKALTVLGPHFDVLCPSGDMSNHVNPMYRLRRPELNPFGRVDLFHIPFDKRHVVSPMRYSITGLPCLYMGGSTLVCVKELGLTQEELPAVYVSRFLARPDSKLKVLNFGWRPALLAAWIKTSPNEFQVLGSPTAIIGAMVACWPLIALCAIKKKHPKAAFHLEYIVPQLVLQWVTNTKKFHGVRYFSTHYKEYHDDPKTYLNYVFPAQTAGEIGHCPQLKGLFELTEPLTWKDALQQPPVAAKRPQYKLKGTLIDVLEKEYGHVESVLLGRPTALLP